MMLYRVMSYLWGNLDAQGQILNQLYWSLGGSREYSPDSSYKAPTINAFIVKVYL